MSNIVKLFLIALIATLLIIVCGVFLIPGVKNKVFGKDKKEEVQQVEDTKEENVVPEIVKDTTLEEKIEEKALQEIREKDDDSMSSKQVKELGELLREREKKIVIEEQRIIRLRNILKQERDHITQMKSDIEKLHTEIAEFIPLISSSEKKNLKKMAKMFETLSVENASPIMERMPDQTLVIVLSLMKPRASAKLLGGYAGANKPNAERAGIITEKLKKLVVK